MAVIGVGIVGCGGNALNHAEVWSSMDEANIVGVCDIDEQRAKERADLLGVKAFLSVEDLVKEPGLDVVDVVTSASHRDPAVIGAEAGKHVLVENPFAVTVAEADDMIAAAEKAGVNLMYAQTHRFYPHSLKAKELIDAGELGDLISLTYDSLRSTHGASKDHNWPRMRASGGGYFMYEGTHFIDQFRWLMGSEFEKVYAVGMGRYVSGGDGEDNGLAGFTFKSGAFGALRRGTSDPGAPKANWRLVGTKGTLDVVSFSSVSLGNNGEWRDIPYPYQGGQPIKTLTREREPGNYHGFLTEFKEFVDSIAEGRQPSCTGYDGRASTEGAMAIIKSHETGLPVQLPLS